MEPAPGAPPPPRPPPRRRPPPGRRRPRGGAIATAAWRPLSRLASLAALVACVAPAAWGNASEEPSGPEANADEAHSGHGHGEEAGADAHGATADAGAHAGAEGGEAGAEEAHSAHGEETGAEAHGAAADAGAHAGAEAGEAGAEAHGGHAHGEEAGADAHAANTGAHAGAAGGEASGSEPEPGHHADHPEHSPSEEAEGPEEVNPSERIEWLKQVSAFRVFHSCGTLRELNGALFVIAGSHAHPGDESEAGAHEEGEEEAGGADAHGETAGGSAHAGAEGGEGTTVEPHAADASGGGTTAAPHHASPGEEPGADAAHGTTAGPHGAAEHTAHGTTSEAPTHEPATTASTHESGGHRRLGHHGEEEGEEGPGEHEHKESPFYKAAKSDFYIHFGHVCSSSGKVEFGWLIDRSAPHEDEDAGAALRGSRVHEEHEACGHHGQIQWFMHDGPPLGTTTWRMQCDGEFRDVPVTLRVEERSSATTSMCLPASRPGLKLEDASFVADVRLIDLEWAWLRIDTEGYPRHRRLEHTAAHVEAPMTTTTTPGSNEGQFFPARLYPERALRHGHDQPLQTSHSARWIAATFGHQGLYMVQIGIEMEGKDIYLHAIRARYLENVTRFRKRDISKEVSELFHAPGILALHVGCPGDVQVDSLTLDFLYRRIHGLATPPGTAYKAVLITMFVILLSCLIGMKIIMCRRTLREARSIVADERSRQAMPYSEESGVPKGHNLRDTAAADSGRGVPENAM